MKSSPAVGTDGAIYFGHYGTKVGFFTALNSTGSFLWGYTGGYEKEWGFWTPSVGIDGRVYVGGSDPGFVSGRLYAFNTDGTLAWTSGHDEIHSSPAIDSDGTIYAGADYGIYAFSSSGVILWTYSRGGMEEYSSVAIGKGGRIYSGSVDNTIYSLTYTGSLAWSYVTGDDVESSPAIGLDRRLYIGSNDNVLYCFQGPSPTHTPTPNPNLNDFRITDVDDIDGDGYDDLAILKKEAAGDANLYYYNAPVPYDWTYWNAFSRNPSPLARDFWIIPSGNNVIDMAPAILDGGEGGLAIIKRDGASDLNLYLYRNLTAGDWTYWDAYSRNPSPLARDFWMIPSGNDALSLATLDVDGGEGLAVLKREGGVDDNLYLYTLPAAGDWTYWDAYSRNPSPLARDLWIISSGNNVIDIAAVDISLPPDGAGELAVLTRNADDVNIYYYNALLPGDWTYWDAFARNPSPVARDFWMIPSGNDAVSMTALPKATPGQEELAFLKNELQNDLNLYVYETLVPGDWIYWNAYSRNPSALARDFWVIPSP